MFEENKSLNLIAKKGSFVGFTLSNGNVALNIDCLRLRVGVKPGFVLVHIPIDNNIMPISIAPPIADQIRLASTQNIHALLSPSKIKATFDDHGFIALGDRSAFSIFTIIYMPHQRELRFKEI